MNGSILLAATGGAAIDFLEIAVIAYAIARSGYPREALLGSLGGILLVILLSVPLGQILLWIPLQWLERLVGAILLGLGLRWVNKSLQRQAQGRRSGWMSDDPLAAEGITLEPQALGFSIFNFVAMLKSAVLEALEVAILVVTLGSTSQAWLEALVGTTIALGFAIIIVVGLHQYLLQVPEVLIKLGAGILLSALGTFWLGEGIGFHWWLADWSIVAIFGLYSGLAMAALGWLVQRGTENAEQKQV
ncbi:COG4280 domain-containing protein [Alkalinema pantanalense CENA528]|uniref:COG4280 domain-containing protein n=1 Tax=Alkalinema pantanalense TaxID=1620705 RepID=UPI003D6F1F7F